MFLTIDSALLGRYKNTSFLLHKVKGNLTCKFAKNRNHGSNLTNVSFRNSKSNQKTRRERSLLQRVWQMGTSGNAKTCFVELVPWGMSSTWGQSNKTPTRKWQLRETIHTLRDTTWGREDDKSLKNFYKEIEHAHSMVCHISALIK